VLEALGIAPAMHRIEGRSLLPLLRSEATGAWRDAVFAELDYGFRRARRTLGRAPQECRAFMVRTAAAKYVHWEGFRPQLFDLAADPDEYFDRGADAARAAERAMLRERLFDWLATRKHRTTASDADVERHTDTHREHGIDIGVW
jgi:hypothetical protein